MEYNSYTKKIYDETASRKRSDQLILMTYKDSNGKTRSKRFPTYHGETISVTVERARTSLLSFGNTPIECKILQREISYREIPYSLDGAQVKLC